MQSEISFMRLREGMGRPLSFDGDEKSASSSTRLSCTVSSDA